MSLVKINYFNGEIRTAGGTFLVLDGEFGVGVNVKVQTSEGLKDLIDGNYELGCPYDGVLIEIIKGKIKQIINPLKNEPTPNPLETPPNLADGAIAVVPGTYLQKENKDMKTNFDDNKVSTASDGTETNQPETTTGEQTVQTDKATIYTVEQLSSMIDDIVAQLKTLSDKVSKIEGADETQTSTDSTTNSTDNTSADAQKMSAEFKSEIDKKVKEYFDNNSPATLLHILDPDNDIIVTSDPITNFAAQLAEKRRIKFNR